jgi:hypothetical protein
MTKGGFSVTHHCPKKNKGQGPCAPGHKTPDSTPYCGNHQSYCPTCPRYPFHLKTEACPVCDKTAAVREQEQLAAQRVVKDEEIADRIAKEKAEKAAKARGKKKK